MKGYRDLSEWFIDLLHLIDHLEKVAVNHSDDEEHDSQDMPDDLTAAGDGVKIKEKELIAREIYERQEKENCSEILIPAVVVSQRYLLDTLEYYLMLLALSMEADTGLCLAFRQTYHRDLPDFQYALHLLSFVMDVGIEITASLCDPSYKLMLLFMPAQENAQELVLQQPLKLRREVVAFLLSGQLLLPRTGCRFLHETQKAAPLLFHNILEQITLYLVKDGRRILLCGREGSGKRTLSSQVCTQMEANGILVETEQILGEENTVGEAVWGGLSFAARIFPCVLVLSVRDIVKSPQEKVFRRRLAGILARWFAGQRMILLADNDKEKEILYSLADMQISLPDCLDLSQKRLVRDYYFKEEERQCWQLDLAGRHRLTALELAQRLAKLRAAYDGAETGSKNLWYRIFKENTSTVQQGSGVDMPYLLKDFVGTEDNRKQLDQIIRIARIWREQAEGWNKAGAVVPEGLCILFHGESGTGKTMAASLLANELGMMLLRVDLSVIFDKYIGETEKHLEEIMNAAQRSNEILFFDEADALFSKRTEIEDSHDKYANVSVSFLLQRMEEYPGIIILATNLMHHFDGAFLRRIRFVVKFQPLKDRHREELWRKIWAGLPEGLTLSEDITMEELAAAAELSPARIKSCAVTAAMLAASEDIKIIERRHLRDALLWETQKDNTPICNFLGSEDIYE